MTTGDVLGLIFSYVYAFALLFIVESVGKKMSIPQSYSRKIIHIGAGLWVWPLVILVDHWYIGIIPFATFILLNYLFYKKQSFAQMDTEESSPGTIYFAISITILLLAFWRTDAADIDNLPAAMAGIMAMTLGDGFAAIFGKAFGKIGYQTLGHRKTLIGSLAMFIFAFIGIYLSFILIPGSSFSPNSILYSNFTVLFFAVSGAFVGTMLEALSPSGLDNLTVPLFTSFFIYGNIAIIG